MRMVALQDSSMRKSVQPETTIVQDECSPNMYDEFLNCNSYLYNMQDKQNSESISSDGEFNEFNYFELVDETDEKFVVQKYQEMIQIKYSNELRKKYMDGHYIDEELKIKAEMMVKGQAQDRKYLSKRLVT
jgi:hypothetical protein